MVIGRKCYVVTARQCDEVCDHEGSNGWVFVVIRTNCGPLLGTVINSVITRKAMLGICGCQEELLGSK